ncbi:hypothetical protein [Nocardia alba]|uniref:Uncharacterized protein n=1 Tax=Nocardia alba TaxID=225051 RepID=A0A4R1G937_9NOCA|nr:hypothetical protein [Nocardia alba]TCK00572.1 hypothetical protein DFR71_1578 [Nocardia alba]
MGPYDAITASNREREDSCGVTPLDRWADDNHLYLDREAARDLARMLGDIPDLVEDLSDARTRQTRFGTVDYRTRNGAREQRLPFNPAAAHAADHLQSVMVAWVRLVCEQRGIDYSGVATTSGMAEWLQRNIIALAMTEGVEAAPAEIAAAIEAAETVVCPPAELASADADLVLRARAVRLHAAAIGKLAEELGDGFRNLTARRVRTLRKAGLINPVPGPWTPDWPELFIVGEVLDAHRALPVRHRAIDA